MEFSEVDLNQLTVSDGDELQLVDDELSLDEMIDMNCYCFDEGQIIGNKPSHYIIKPYTFEKARENNLLLYVSDNPSKKIDVYDQDGGKFLCAIGDIRYLDYPHLVEKYGEDYANARKQLYYIQQRAKNKKVRNYSQVYYENMLLW